jgi:5'-3' exonuclease
VEVHLIDGTYELFRHFFAVPSSSDRNGNEVGAVRGVLNSVLSMLAAGTTHLGVATDHVIESFRNDLYPGYKTGAGIDPALFSQFVPFENALRAMGVVVWPMIEQEADDAMAAAAQRASEDSRVTRVLICTPDKDLAQCVVENRIVQLDRRKREIRDADAVRAKFGIAPESIPDYLALVGDAADGFPGLPGWGAKSAAKVLARYPHLEDIPKNARDWEMSVRGADKLAAILVGQWDDGMLFRRLATLRTDAEVFDTVDDLVWAGPRPEFEPLCNSMRATDLLEKAKRLQNQNL